MNRPVRTTIVFALLSGLLVVPAAWLLQRLIIWPIAFKLVLWADLAVYAVMLARWSRTSPGELVFPLALLCGVAIWPQTNTGFYLLALGMLSWIRSGICYRGTPVRAAMAEAVGIVGGCALVTALGGGSSAAWALNICLFFLVQSLYFFIVPNESAAYVEPSDGDPFERARQGAVKVLQDDRPM